MSFDLKIIISLFIIFVIALIKETIKEKEINKWKKKKGNKYEYYIKEKFKKHGYKVYPKGYLEGFYDEGIDLIAYRKNLVVLIQCKNWKNEAKIDDLKKFYTDCKKYEFKNLEKIKNKRIRRIFVISNIKRNLEIQEYINNANKEIEFYNIPIT